MKSLNEDKSISVAANNDRGFLPNLQHALGDLADSLRPECGPSFHRDIDFGDWEAFALEHGPHLFGRDPDDQHTEKCWRHGNGQFGDSDYITISNGIVNVADDARADIYGGSNSIAAGQNDLIGIQDGDNNTLSSAAAASFT